MSDLKLEEHYKVELDAVKELYKYCSCRTENIPLFGHQVLPQGYYYGNSIISPDAKYISIIAKGKEDDKSFIWALRNLDSYLFSYTSKSIENFFFSSDSKFFYILYGFEPPVKYDIKTGKEIISFKFPEVKITQMICYNFSLDNQYLEIGTITHFISWNINNGKVFKIKNEQSSIKTIRNNWQISLRDNLEVIIYNNFENQIFKFNIPHIKVINEIISFNLSHN